MKKNLAFEEGKPRTPRSEARRREREALKAMEDLYNLDDETEFKLIVAEEYGILPGHPRFDRAVGYLEGTEAREALSFRTRSTNALVRAFFSASERPISSICSSSIWTKFLSNCFRVFRLGAGGSGVGIADICLTFPIDLCIPVYPTFR
jgi:hypothetical protein